MRSLSRRRQDQQAAQLARVADGSLSEARSRRLREQAAASTAWGVELANQERALRLVRAWDEPAPPSLHARVAQMVAESQPEAQQAPAPVRARKAHLRRPLGGISLGAVCAAGVLTAVLALGGSTPTLAQTVHLALASSTMPAPASTPSGDLSLGSGIRFPSWLNDTAWHASGARVDSLDGRRIETVFYTDQNGRRIGYAIVSGAPLTVPHETTRMIDGVVFTVARTGKTTVVTWVHAGHTCVIAGRSVSASVALTLATDA